MKHKNRSDGLLYTVNCASCALKGLGHVIEFKYFDKNK
jgi:hypothetical protein